MMNLRIRNRVCRKNIFICIAALIWLLSISMQRSFQQTATVEFFGITEMGDKYLTDSTAEQKKAWRNRILREAVKNEKRKFHSIFNCDDGGPLGCEWNTNANLFCILRFSGDKSSKRNYQITLNDVSFSAKVKERYSKNKIIAYFDLPAKVWEKRLKETTKEDFRLVFDSATATSKVPHIIDAMIALNYCIVKVQIKDSLATKECKGIIRVAYGE